MKNILTFSDFLSLGVISDLEILAANNQCVLWARDKKYDRQLYLSGTYNHFWGREPISLYQNPSSWGDTLDVPDGKLFSEELKKNRTITNENYTSIFCVILPNGQRNWFQDRSVQLPIASHTHSIVAGCAIHVPHKSLFDTEQDAISEKLDFIITQFHQLLISTCATIEIEVNDNDIKLLSTLSRREQEVLKLFLQGKTIVQVADTIFLSPRTVEGYLNNLKNKLACESKSELIMKSIERGWLMVTI